MRTSSARNNDWHCPACGDDTTQDPSGNGFVRHKKNRDCQFERTQRDSATVQANPGGGFPKPIVDIPDEGLILLGYSERGVINSLFYQILHDDSRSMGRLAGFLSMIKPSPPIKGPIKRVVVLIEQSFSDFGDSDAVILIDSGSGDESIKLAIFIEAKVKTQQSGAWTVQKEWRKFLSGIECRPGSSVNKSFTSNLFCQLHLKVRLAEALREDNGFHMNKTGSAFPEECFKKKRGDPTLRRIGGNEVVRKAAALLREYTARAYFVMLVPDTPANTAAFFSQELKSLQGPNGWDSSCWAYLCWSEVEAFCNAQGLEQTASIFNFNQGQIY